MLSLFKKPKVEAIFNLTKEYAYIRNGHGFGFISDEFLYNNRYLEIGFGKVVSDYGDWGGGFTHASTSPIKVVIDDLYSIKKIDTDSFYNTDKKIEREAKKIIRKIKIGDKLKINSEILKEHIDRIFKLLPYSNNIGYDVFDHPHMLGFYEEEQLKKGVA